MCDAENCPYNDAGVCDADQVSVIEVNECIVNRVEPESEDGVK